MIFTFYSYKGGVGRSMTLAATAQVLASRGLEVLAIDFDLEAPGLERYFYGDDESRARRAELGLMDLIRKYREALTDEAAFERAEFKRLNDFIFEAVHDAGSRGGSVDLLRAGRREPAEAMREYALAVRNFDWQDFFYNWKGGRFFEWLCRQWNDPDTGYDVVLVDSRTGVTEMGGVCAYQLADAVVLLCAPNHQNLEGTRDVARDFVSDSVRGLRQARPLQILAIPARLDAKHPKRDEFLAAFTREMGTMGLPMVLAEARQTYETLALPYLPELSVGESLVGCTIGGSLPGSASSGFERLADALTLLADPETALGRQQNQARARLAGEAVEEATPLEADTTKGSSGYDVFIDAGVEDRAHVFELARRLGARGLTVFFDFDEAQAGANDRLERALGYSANLVFCFGKSADSSWREQLLRAARRNPNLMIIPVLLPGGDAKDLRSFGLEAFHYFDWRRESGEAEIDRFVGMLFARSSRNEAGSVESRSPFPGASPYGEEDSSYFHGRSVERDALRQAVVECQLVLLEGPARVGKTSLVRAGLLPLLRSIGSSTVKRIAYVDAGQGAITLPEWARGTRARSIGEAKDPFDLIIIDGLDSTDVTGSSATRRDPLRVIDDLARRLAPSLHLLIVWRGTLANEHYDTALASWSSREGFRMLTLEPLTAAALREAIENPAKATGQLLENGLVERLVESSGTAKSAIFQIQIALAEIWQRRRRGWLTNRSLDAIGHLGGFFQNYMGGFLDALSEGDRIATKDLFRALTEVNTRGEWLPRSVSWGDVQSIPSVSRAGADRLRDTLATAGLIDLWREKAGPLPTAGGGPRLSLVRPDARGYFKEPEAIADELFLRWRSALSAALRLWETSGGNVDALLPLEAVAEAKNWLDSQSDRLTDRERRFVDQSIKARWVDFVLDGQRDSGDSEASVASGTVKDSISRGDSPAPGSRIEVSAVPGEDVIALNFEGGASLVLHPATARDLLTAPATPGLDDETDAGAHDDADSAGTPAPPQPSAGAVMGGILRSLQVLKTTGAANQSLSSMIERLETRVRRGVYRFPRDTGSPGNTGPLAEIPPPPVDSPTLVLLHGPLLDANTTFGPLWKQPPELISALHARYQDRVFALEHPTLTTTPLENALALAEACPVGARVDLLAHSGGGLVADALARMAAQHSVRKRDAMIFSPSRNDAAALDRLATVVRQRSLRIGRVVRVACPSRGNTLASKQLDAYLSVFMWALQRSGAEVPAELKLLVVAVARGRTDPSAMPGLAALLPDSALIRWLNNPDDPIPGDLRVIAGSTSGKGLMSWMSTLLRDFSLTDTDLVVSTSAMFGGVPRSSGSSFFLDQGTDVQHFGYFSNARTAMAVVDALLSDEPEGFRPIGALSWAGESSQGAR